jgi:superoxide reductase
MEIYRCSHCKLQLEVTAEAGVPAPICCGEPMSLQVANTQDAAKEKHVPVLETPGDGILVKVGSVAHPMTEEHYIEWVCLETEHGIQYAHLNPDDKPKAKFAICDGDEIRAVYAFCNQHDLWRK